MIELIKLEKCQSTNSYLSSIAQEKENDVVVTAIEQTAGRGQRGNSWEAAPGKNLTCSILMHNSRGIRAVEQFVISEAVSLGIVDTIRNYLPKNFDVRIKWPNDIYVGDHKICGILIEHSISGNGINRSIVGIGINVNQADFLSDAPNPVSIYNLAGSETSIDEMLQYMLGSIYYWMDRDAAHIHDEYKKALWRKDFNRYVDCRNDEDFDASIIDVLPDGTLCLLDSHGKERRFLFKEVAVKLRD